MISYVTPTLKNSPERIVIHCGRNDLKLRAPQSIADDIVTLVGSSKQGNNNVIVSALYQGKIS